MKTVAVTMVKDEADIVDTTIRHMLTQVSAVAVADNMSTDDTPGILADIRTEHPDRVLLMNDETVGYYQSEKMTKLAHLAHDEFGADWVVPFDADEIWYSPFYRRIEDHLAEVAEQWLAMPATVYDHVASGNDPDPDTVADPVERISWRRFKPIPLCKVACRYRPDLVIEMGNHAVTYQGGTTIHDPQLVVRHFPYRSVDQLIRKIRNGAAAYRATNLNEQFGAHWREWGVILEQSGPDAIEELFRQWYWAENPVDGKLVYDPAPTGGSGGGAASATR